MVSRSKPLSLTEMQQLQELHPVPKDVCVLLRVPSRILLRVCVKCRLLPARSTSWVAPKNEIKVQLPPGIHGLEDWADTLRALPKVKRLKLCYGGFWADREIHDEYLIWVIDHGKNRGGRLEDFYNYLTAVGYERKSPGELFPGSRTARKKKSELR